MANVFEKIGKFFNRALGETGTTILQTGLFIGSAIAGLTPLGIGLFIAGAILTYSSVEYEKSLLEESIKDNGHLVNTYGKVEQPIPLVFGKTRVGGNVIFQKTAGGNNKDLLTALTLCEAPIKTIYDIQLNEKSIFGQAIEEKTSISKKTKEKHHENDSQNIDYYTQCHRYFSLQHLYPIW